MEISTRRYDIDWLRVIAIGLLLFYHTAIVFQPWGKMIGFITDAQTWESLWVPMKMLNIWRIPLLFFVSGMGIYFSLQNRNWKQLIAERATRILLPFVFAYFVIVPIQILIWLDAYEMPYQYLPNSAHVWFLGNLFVYVLLFSGFFIYLKNRKASGIAISLVKIFSHPLSVILVMAAFVAEAIWMNPFTYELYASTWHGFFIGLLAFFFGFCFVYAGSGFWNMVKKGKWIFLLAGALLYTYRLFQDQMRVPNYLLAVESVSWILSVFGFAYQYLNRPSNILNYLNSAVYPIYIVHMIVLFVGSRLLMPLQLPVYVKFVLLLIFTTVVSWTLYEFLLRRVKIIRPLFGLKMK